MSQREQEKEATTPLGAYVRVGTLERLRQVAREQDRSMSSLVRLALDDYLQREAEQVAS